MKKRKDKRIQDEKKELVLARLRATSKATSKDLGISIGSTEYSQEDLIKRVEAGDKIGKEIIDIQMEYLRDMARGAIYKDSE